MIRKDDILDSIRVASPCSASWDDMYGDARTRHCADCRLQVYNIAEMERDEVLRLIREHEGRLCFRLYRRRDGTVITRDCPTGVRAVRRKAATAVVCAVGLFASIAAFAMSGPGRKPSPTWARIRIHDAAWRAKLPSFVRSVIDAIDPLPVSWMGKPVTATAPATGNVIMGAVMVMPIHRPARR